MRREVRLGQDLAHLVDDLGVLQLARREVDGHVARRIVRVLAAQLGREAARLLQHPAADRHDQPGLLRERDEVERGHEATRRVVPADERLEPADVAVRELDHRLVVELELVVVERALQVGLELEPADRGLVHLGLEDLVAGLPALLRDVHRDVGVAQERLRAR